MKESAVPAGPLDYGLDAPGVVRNLLLAGGIGLLVFATVALGFWGGVISVSIAGLDMRLPLAGPGLGCGIGCTLMALWMIWDSKVGKIRGRQRLLDNVTWRGDERVLDVGCGRGLLLVGAARRLRGGTATGIDIWQAEDLSGNRPEATLNNAKREGVADRVEVKTADMREIPFPDGSFDVVVSNAAIHNLYAPADRARAIREIGRVLKPGGQALVADIRHGREYAALFTESGCEVIRRIGSPLVSLFLAFVTMGSMRPATLLVRKAAR